MFEFFRKKQRILITIVAIFIIVSFVFFGKGTSQMSTMRKHGVSDNTDDVVVFKDIGGREFGKFFFDKMKNFLATDCRDFFPNRVFPNLLNDGVIYEDFAKTSIGEVVAKKFVDSIGPEWEKKFLQEKAFVPYVHPKLSGLSAMNILENGKQGDIGVSFIKYKYLGSAMEEEAIKTRLVLFAAQKEMMPLKMKQVIRYYEKLYGVFDQELGEKDVAMFGYYSALDWFGENFIEGVVRCILNVASIAKRRGIQVDDEEVLLDLRYVYEKNLQKFLQEYGLSQPFEGLSFGDSLRRFFVDEKEAIKIWGNVLLFRKYMIKMGNNVFYDTLLAKDFVKSGEESVDIDLYQLPKIFRFKNKRQLYKFQMYLSKIAYDNDSCVFCFPGKFIAPDTVAKFTPSLVKKRFLVNAKSLEKKSLMSSISIKDVREWIYAHWGEVVESFNIVGNEKKFIALKTDDQKDIENFAREAIFKKNVEDEQYVKGCLEKESFSKEEISVIKDGGSSYIAGSNGREELLLEILRDEERSSLFSLDGENFYSIKILDESSEWEVLSFEEAESLQIVDRLLEEFLVEHYKSINNGNEDNFEVEKDSILESCFKPFLESIVNDYNDTSGESKSAEDALYLRFFKGANVAMDNILNEETMENEENIDDNFDNKLSPKLSLEKQWQWTKESLTLQRSSKHPFVDIEGLFSERVEGWSKVFASKVGNVYFFKVLKYFDGNGSQHFDDIMDGIRDNLSLELQKMLVENALFSD